MMNDQQTWNNIDSLVQKFQDGDESAGVELLNRFENYFNKFYNIIKNCNIDFFDRESRFFISLFMNKADYVSIRRPYHTSETISKGMQIASFISNTYGQLPDEDIRQDFYTIFFRLVKRYKPMGKNFGAYLCTSFVYELARHVQAYLKDPITRGDKVLPYYDNHDDQNKLNMTGELRYSDIGVYTDEVDFSDAWVRGITCSDEFSCLTSFERAILVKYYIEDKTDQEIANETGFKRNSINKKRAKAISRIRNKMIEDGNTY